MAETVNTTPETVKTVARRGFFPAVIGKNVEAREAGAAAFIAGKSLHLEQGGGQWLVSLGNMDVRRGGGAVLAGRTVRLEQGFVGCLVAGKAEIGQGARVLVRATPALALAAAAGFIGGLLIGRNRRS
jgi:hypothetical protein